MKVVGLSALAGRPMDSCSCVRACVRDGISRKPRIRFWWFFCTKLHFDESKKCSERTFEKKFFWPFFAIFRHFLLNRSSEFHVTCSKTRNNCFQSFNGSFVSGKILVLAVLSHFWSKIHCLWWQIEVFDHFWPISCNMLMFVWQLLFLN